MHDSQVLQFLFTVQLSSSVMLYIILTHWIAHKVLALCQSAVASSSLINCLPPFKLSFQACDLNAQASSQEATSERLVHQTLIYKSGDLKMIQALFTILYGGENFEGDLPD